MRMHPHPHTHTHTRTRTHTHTHTDTHTHTHTHTHMHTWAHVHTHTHTHTCTLTLTDPTVLFNATSKGSLCFNAHFSYIFLPRYLQISSLWVAFASCGKGPLDLVQTGLTVPTLALGCVQFPVRQLQPQL